MSSGPRRDARDGARLHRFFIDPDAFGPFEVTIPPNVSHQIKRVLRLKAEDRIVALDGSGMEYTVRIDYSGDGRGWIIEERRRNEAETLRTVVLYQGFLKASKLETVLQKCTEIGVSRFVPVATARSIPTAPSADRLQRFETIAREAAEQSGRGIVPAVERPMAFEKALLRACSDGPVIVLHEGEHALRLDGLDVPGSAPVALFVGPEGGFDVSEIAASRAAGATVAGLGPRVLRSETAAIAGSALLISRLEVAAGPRSEQTTKH